MRQFRFFKGIRQPYELFQTNTLSDHELVLEQTVEDQERRIETLQRRVVELQNRIQELSSSPRHGSENRRYRDTQRIDSTMVQIITENEEFLNLMYKQQFQRLCDKIYEENGYGMIQQMDSTTGEWTNTMEITVAR